MSYDAKAEADALCKHCEHKKLTTAALERAYAAGAGDASERVRNFRPEGGRAWTAEQAFAYEMLTKVADALAGLSAAAQGTGKR